MQMCSFTDAGYLLTDARYTAKCCGVIHSWTFYTTEPGLLSLLVWRSTENVTYVIVGENNFFLTKGKSLKTVRIHPFRQIPFVEGDVIGWVSLDNVSVAYGNCNAAETYISLKVTYSSQVFYYDTLTATSVPNRIYALQAHTKPAEPLIVMNSGESRHISIHRDDFDTVREVFTFMLHFPNEVEPITYQNVGIELQEDYGYFFLNYTWIDAENVYVLMSDVPPPGEYLIQINVTSTCGELVVGTQTLIFEYSHLLAGSKISINVVEDVEDTELIKKEVQHIGSCNINTLQVCEPPLPNSTTAGVRTCTRRQGGRCSNGNNVSNWLTSVDYYLRRPLPVEPAKSDIRYDRAIRVPFRDDESVVHRVALPATLPTDDVTLTFLTNFSENYFRFSEQDRSIYRIQIDFPKEENILAIVSQYDSLQLTIFGPTDIRSPRFVDFPNLLQVSEDVILEGQAVFQLRIVTRILPFQVRFSADCGIHGDYVRVNERTGEIIISKSLDIDKQSSDLVLACQMTVEDQCTLSQTKQLFIFITDINDNRPIFRREKYSFCAEPKNDVGTIVGEVIAVDDDLTMKNHKVSYNITSVNETEKSGLDLFEINDMGQIVTLSGVSSLDYGTVVRLTIKAFDLSREGPTTVVYIFILKCGATDRVERLSTDLDTYILYSLVGSLSGVNIVLLVTIAVKKSKRNRRRKPQATEIPLSVSRVKKSC